MPEWVGGVLSALVTAAFLFVGTRFVAKQSREVGEQQVEVEQRKVDQEAFDRFVDRYEQDRSRQQTIITETRTLLRAALKHINILRGEMREHRVPTPPLPAELEDVPWDMYSGDQP
jgi:hypothetical protein